MLTYSVQDRSILLPHYKRFLVEPLLAWIPAKVDPNAITHVGHALNLAALALLAAFEPAQPRGWLYIAVALLVHAYLWCDNADGSHARRTNQCSAKGEFLDHGLDLLNATYVATMTVMTFGAPPFWGFAAAVAVPAAAAVTYWEQAETGVFHLGLLNQIESICALTVVLVVRGLYGPEVFGPTMPSVVLAIVAAASLLAIAGSVVRVARKRGRLAPFVAPGLFGLAVSIAAATGALPTTPAIVAGAVVFVFVGIRQLTLRVRGERPLVERGVLAAAGLLAVLACYQGWRGGESRLAGWAAATFLTVAFGGLALARAVEGHREVARLDAAR